MTAIDSPILFPTGAPVAARPGIGIDSVDCPVASRNKTIRTTGPIVTAIAAVLTCGLLPLLGWLWQWNGVRSRDQQEHSAGPAIANRSSLLLWTALLIPALLVAELGWMGSQGLSAEQIRHALLGRGELLRFDRHAGLIVLRLPMFWTVGLSIAYGCYWAAVRLHARRQLALARIAKLGTGLKLSWVIVAVGFGVDHLWWGIPMVLAGAQQRRYLSLSHLRWERPSPVRPTTLCNSRRCQGVVPVSARFCPRCGTARA